MTYDQRAQMRAKYHALRRAWFEANGPCVLCGSRDRLEVDHIDPHTKVSHHIWGWREERREEELRKCRALCYTCHRRLSGEQQTARMTRLSEAERHGRYATYVYRKCRCEACREAKRRYDRERYARNRGLLPV